MNHLEFEQFVLDSGMDILRFCRMTAGNEERGDELYQDTMLKLLERLSKIDPAQNVKSYALSVSILLWKSKKKKYAVRRRILPTGSLEEYMENGGQAEAEGLPSSEEQALSRLMAERVRALVSELPERYRLPLYLHYSAGMKLSEIAECLHLPCNTVKTRVRRAREQLKKELEAIGYDG